MDRHRTPKAFDMPEVGEGDRMSPKWAAIERRRREVCRRGLRGTGCPPNGPPTNAEGVRYAGGGLGGQDVPLLKA